MEKATPIKGYYRSQAQEIFNETSRDHAWLVRNYLNNLSTLHETSDATADLVVDANQMLEESNIIGSDAIVGPGAYIPTDDPEEDDSWYTTSKETLYGTYQGLTDETDTDKATGEEVPQIYHVFLIDDSINVRMLQGDDEPVFALVPFNEADRIGIELLSRTPGATRSKEAWKQAVISEAVEGKDITRLVANAYEKIVFAKRSRLITDIDIDWLCDYYIQHAKLKDQEIEVETTFVEEVYELTGNVVVDCEDTSIFVAGTVIDVATMENYYYEEDGDLSQYEPRERWRKLKRDIALIVNAEDDDGAYIAKVPLRAIKQQSSLPHRK